MIADFDVWLKKTFVYRIFIAYYEFNKMFKIVGTRIIL